MMNPYPEHPWNEAELFSPQHSGGTQYLSHLVKLAFTIKVIIFLFCSQLSILVGDILPLYQYPILFWEDIYLFIIWREGERIWVCACMCAHGGQGENLKQTPAECGAPIKTQMFNWLRHPGTPISYPSQNLHPLALKPLMTFCLNQLPYWWLPNGDFSVYIIPSAFIQETFFFPLYLYIHLYQYELRDSYSVQWLIINSYHCLFWYLWEPLQAGSSVTLAHQHHLVGISLLSGTVRWSQFISLYTSSVLMLNQPYFLGVLITFSLESVVFRNQCLGNWHDYCHWIVSF